MKAKVKGQLIIAIGCLVAVGVHAEPNTTIAAQSLDRFLHGSRPILTTYRARRVLEASTLGGKMRASLEAWTYVDAKGKFGFDVIREQGSAVIRDHVLLKALEIEQSNFNSRETDQVELTPANYDFRVRGADGDVVTISIMPRRRSPMLVDGSLAVTRNEGAIVRIEGMLSETPSWWTRRVEIDRRYSQINGVRVPVQMASRADIRVVGDSTFLMTYTYTMINGRAVF